MTTSRAKELFKCGIRSVQALAVASVESVEKAVAKSLPRRGIKRKKQKEQKLLVPSMNPIENISSNILLIK